MKKWLPVSFLVLGLIGAADASYLTIEHYRSASVGCVIFNGCDTVLASSYATIGTMPVSLLGALYYFAILFLVALYFYLRFAASPQAEPVFDFMIRFTLIGFLASLYFVYLQLFVLQAICTYCMVSAFTSTTLFILGVVVMYKEKSMESVRA